jgi:hypothetical protein
MGSSFRGPRKIAGLVLAALATGAVAHGADRAPADNGGAASSASSPSGPSPAPGTYTGPDATVPSSPPSSPPAPKTARPRAADADTDDTDTDSEAPKRNIRKVPQRIDQEIPKRRPSIPDPAAADSPRPVESVSGPQVHARREPPERPPVAAPARPSQVEELIQRSSDSVDFFELVDDILDEIARRIALEDPNLLSPMAIRLVRLSANLRPEFARTLEARLVARLVNATTVKVIVCAECQALRSRVEDGSWIITLGAVKQEDLRRLGETTGIKTFLDVDFTYSPESNVIWLEAMAFRASDGGVVWSDAYRSDGTMTALLRTGQRIPSRAERAAELEQKIAGRPSYGYAASLGMAQIGYAGPTGNVIGAQVALRFHERFGENQGSLFGLSAGIFTTGPPSSSKQPQALNSILLGAYYSYDLSPPNLNKPELWIYGEGGGMFTGNEGNTFYLESGLDLHLKWRLSMSGGLMYVFPTQYSGYDLGGLGFRLRVAMNW